MEEKKYFPTIDITTLTDIEKVYLDALSQWGYDAQIKMCIEECGELITALAQYYRNRNTNDDICSEIADVKIMTEQMSLIFGKDKVEEQYKFKFKRLQERLEKYKQSKNLIN